MTATPCGTALTLGETMVLLRGDRPGGLHLGTPFSTSIAGAESTVAIGLARLGHASEWLGRVGADVSGDLVVEVLRGAGVDVHGVIVDPAEPTGLLLRTPRLGNAQQVTYHRRGSAGSRLRPADVDAGWPEDLALLHVSGITPALSPTSLKATVHAVSRAHHQGATVSYDVNLRTKLTSVARAADVLTAVMPYVDVLFCGADEMEVLAMATSTADPVAAILQAGVVEVVVKRGREGAVVHTVAGPPVVGRSYRVPVVDVIGAGDAFVAGYLSARLDGEAIKHRLARGAAVAAFCVATVGDWEGLPTRPELVLLAGDLEAADR